MPKLNTRFNLKEPKSKGETSIRLVIRYANFTLYYYIGESINPKFWDAEKQRPKNVKSFPRYLELKSILDFSEKTAVRVFDAYYTEQSKLPSKDILKNLLDTELRQIEVATPTDSKHSLFTFIDQFIKERPSRLNPSTQQPYAARTIKAYYATYHHLQEFALKNKAKYPTLEFESIDMNFYLHFTDWLTQNKNLTTNTIGKHVKYLKTFLNEAVMRGLTSNIQFKNSRFKVVKEDVDHIYLTVEEISKINSLDLSQSPRLERVRDLFIVGCWTGLRFSDFTTIEKKNFVEINEGGLMLNILTKKTSQPVWIPLHPMILPILSRYEGKTPNSLPTAISNQKMNSYLKEIGRLAEIDNDEVITKTKGGKRIDFKNKKYDLISTHTARRSFATNQYLAGIPPYTIMQVTGHRTESAFLRYIKITPKEHALKMAELWKSQFTNNQ